MSQKNVPSSVNTPSTNNNTNKPSSLSERKNKGKHVSDSNTLHFHSEQATSSHQKFNSSPARQSKPPLKKEAKQNFDKVHLSIQKKAPENTKNQLKPPITIPNTPRTLSQIITIQKYFRRALAQRELEKRCM
jgi:hypothetical protein